jgi:hypothetical protein
MWFKFPLHMLDETGTLQDIRPEDEGRYRRERNLSQSGKKKKTQAERDQECRDVFEEKFAMLDINGTGKVSKDEFLTLTLWSQSTLKRRLELFKNGEYYTDNQGNIRKDSKK